MTEENLFIITYSLNTVVCLLVTAGLLFLKPLRNVRNRKYRNACRILAFASAIVGSGHLLTLLVGDSTQTDAEAAGLISKGDVVVLTAGVPLGVSGTTNLIKVQVAGHILVKGKGIAGKKIAANLCVCHSEEDLANFKEGDIIVAADTNNCMMKQMRQASGLIVEADSDSCHAAIAGLSLDIPVLIGAKNALEVLKSSAYVELDSENGVVTAI